MLKNLEVCWKMLHKTARLEGSIFVCQILNNSYKTLNSNGDYMNHYIVNKIKIVVYTTGILLLPMMGHGLKWKEV